MKRLLFNLTVSLAIILPAALAQAQSKKKPRVVESTPTVISEANTPSSPPQNRTEIFKAADIYKNSLRQLLAARENEAAQAAERFVKLRELYKDGFISRLQLEESERELVELHHKVEETRNQLVSTDTVVVESIAEKDSGSVAEFEAVPKTRNALKRVAYIRYKGTVDWSASDIGKIDQFFQAKFKRPLPVAALGQSEFHTRLGLDHTNAVDVDLHPDSSEGRELMKYLSKSGIPFMAFRRRVPGSVTGAHIHIGKS
jgi:hypothetical protein